MATPTGRSEDPVKAMPTIEAQSKNKAGEVTTYSGVSLKELLALAAPAGDATTVVFVAGDGCTAEIALADAMACADCIVLPRRGWL